MFDEVEYLRWLNSARKTLESAHGDLERGDFNWACFKAQQSAEIATKALLYGLGVPAYGHSVSKLLSSIRFKEVSVSDKVLGCAKALDKYYIPTRYPNAWVEGAPHEYYTKEDADNAITCAKIIIEWVEETWKSLKRGKD